MNEPDERDETVLADETKHLRGRTHVRAVPAGFWIRSAALLIDGLILSPLTLVSLLGLSAKSQWLCTLAIVPTLFYKPCMESYFGATLGKMLCGLRVMNQRGETLSLLAAYLRFSPNVIGAAINWVSLMWLFPTPAFQDASGIMELGEVMRGGTAGALSATMSWVMLIDCVTAGFTQRKRAIHDMLAGSFCVRDVIMVAREPVRETAADQFLRGLETQE